MSQVLLTQWARLLIDSLVQSGVQQAVISPGSRSTPFAWAALQHPGLRCSAAIDERAGGFFALGQARVSQRPSLLICTSGTAPAHYFPAILEAAAARLPLLVLSADRPRELQYRAAPQTIDQPGMFGSHVRASFDLGTPQALPTCLRALQATAAQAVVRALEPDPGPVHLNAPARKPLPPLGPHSDGDRALIKCVDGLIEQGPTRFLSPGRARPGGAERLATDMARAERGLIACGPIASMVEAHAASQLAELSGFPLLAEISSQLVFGTSKVPVHAGIDVWLRAPAARRLKPDLIVEVGAPLTSQAWADYTTEQAAVLRHVIAPHAWPDVAASARCMHGAHLHELLEAIDRDSLAAFGPARQLWARQVAELAEHGNRKVNEVLAELPFGEAHAVREVCRALPQGSLFVIGNSLPIRAADAFATTAARGVHTLVQRGVNGIDGLISGAAGAGLLCEASTTLLLGDVSLAHDVGGLMLAREAKRALVIVVLDNAGGRIFDELPWGEAAGATTAEREFWLTPPRLDLQALARAYGLAYEHAEDGQSLSLALERGYQRAGATLLRVSVAPGSYRAAIARAQAGEG